MKVIVCVLLVPTSASPKATVLGVAERVPVPWVCNLVVVSAEQPDKPRMAARVRSSTDKL